MINNDEFPSVSDYQVFLNYPFDEAFELCSHAMHFAVVAANLMPVCANDGRLFDRPRLERLYNQIFSCRYSAHDLSLYQGQGTNNLARFNMPIELGMTIYYSYSSTNRHSCAFFVTTAHDYQRFASDLAGLDPPRPYHDDLSLVRSMYEWLKIVARNYAQLRPTPHVLEKYQLFKEELTRVSGSEESGHPTHDEAQEVILQLCSHWGWWEWRNNDIGRRRFPEVPLAWRH